MMRAVARVHAFHTAIRQMPRFTSVGSSSGCGGAERSRPPPEGRCSVSSSKSFVISWRVESTSGMQGGRQEGTGEGDGDEARESTHLCRLGAVRSYVEQGMMSEGRLLQSDPCGKEEGARWGQETERQKGTLMRILGDLVGLKDFACREERSCEGLREYKLYYSSWSRSPQR